MAELIVPVLITYINELKSRIVDLQAGNPPDPSQVALSLCELSRDIRSELGPPEEAPADLVSDLVDSLRQAADAVGGLGSDFASYADNIRQRANAIQIDDR